MKKFVDGLTFSVRGNNLHIFGIDQDKVGGAAKDLAAQLVRDLVRLRNFGVTFDNVPRELQTTWHIGAKRRTFRPNQIVIEAGVMQELIQTHTTRGEKPPASMDDVRNALRNLQREVANRKAKQKRHPVELSEAELRAVHRGLTRGNRQHELSAEELDTLVDFLSRVPPWRESRISFHQFKNMAHFYRNGDKNPKPTRNYGRS